MMKKLLFTIVFLLSIGKAAAFGYQEASSNAWFLTDKMAYELNLTDDQYERAYQINLDYLMSINNYNDCYNDYWTYRNNDFYYILSSSQYALFSSLDYFFRPIRRLANAWYFPVTSRYNYNFYYFRRPTIYASYYGNPWTYRRHNTPSMYRDFYRRHDVCGMRDSYRPGYARRSYDGSYGYDNRRQDNYNRGNYGNRQNGYDNRYNGYNNRNNGYDNRNNGYDNRQNGYNNRQNGYDNRNNGYDNRNNGYNNRQDYNRGNSGQTYNRHDNVNNRGNNGSGNRWIDNNRNSQSRPVGNVNSQPQTVRPVNNTTTSAPQRTFGSRGERPSSRY